jgi:hypothetical protein
VRLLYIVSSLAEFGAGAVLLGMPGFAQPLSEWRLLFSRLRGFFCLVILLLFEAGGIPLLYRVS